MSLIRLAAILALGLPLVVRADVVLPYSTRTRAYSGYQPTIRGDNLTVGMAGATVAIPDSISTLEMNPAGLTMTMGSVTAQINSNEVTDKVLTGSDQVKVRSHQWGMTVTPNQWGFGLTGYSPSFEGGPYTSPTTGRRNDYEVSTHQYRLSASRSLMSRKLSLGASLVLIEAERKIGELSDNANGLSFQLGAIYHVGNHFLLGASYSPPQRTGSDDPFSGGLELPGFARPIETPMILNVGSGWIPNRFASAGFSVAAVGSTRNTALLLDDSTQVGRSFTLQPRLGASYVLAEWESFRMTAAAGSYYEASRVQASPNRLHGTFAMNANIYFVNAGFGVDRATRYNNVFFSVGFDIVRTIRTFGIIPKETVPPYEGILPPATAIDPDGLPDGLTHGESKEFAAPSASDVKQIIEQIPQNIGNKLQGKPTIPEIQDEKAQDRQRRPSKKRTKAKKKPSAAA